jgi:hypothetical protein
LFYICPEVSFLSVKDHPFKDHDKVYHDLSVPLLEEVYQFCFGIKERAEQRAAKKAQKALEKKKNRKTPQFEEEPEEEEEEEDDEVDIQYTCVIIDDHAATLKEIDIQKQLSKMLIKSRHICCSFIFTLQSYYYFPKILRKQVTNLVLFKVKNNQEWESISKEVLKMSRENGMVLYDYVFDAPYNHLDIDTVNDIFYKNFNLLEIKNV